MVLSKIYSQLIGLRNYLYDRGVFETFDLGARTISVGNITTGGTGKTPLVTYVAEVLAGRGDRVCILTRGYGRKHAHKRVLVSDSEHILANAGEAGDEPFELAQKLLGKAIVIADADRVAAAEWAKRKFGVTAFVLDDGFQHRKVKRDADIVCIDAMNPFGGGNVLPSGRLREPLANLKRADVVIITRSNLVKDISKLRSEISDLNMDAAIFEAKNEVVNFVPLGEFPAKTQRTQSKEKEADVNADKNKFKRLPAFAFCGIGNPQNFFEQLRQEDFSLAATKTFRDHHKYTLQDISAIERSARENHAEILLTTTKDAVKLTDLKFEIPCFVVEIKTTIDDKDAFEKML